MALAPKFAGQRFTLAQKPNKAIHTIELYLDYVCPFSAKMYQTLFTSVLPHASSKAYAANVQFLFRQQIQPWHPSSTLVHEAGVAVLRLAPGKFWDFSEKLMEKQKEYFDVNVVHEARNQTYARLAKLGASVGVDEKKMYGLLEVSDKPDKDGGLNIGNAVTDDLKVLVKVSAGVGFPRCILIVGR